MNALVNIYPAIIRALDLIGQGFTKTRACDECQVSVATFNRYVTSDPQLAELAEEAATRGYDTLADILLEIDSNRIYGSSDAKMAAVISKNIQWYLSRRRPKEYGNTVTVDVNISADKVIVDALSRAKVRANTGETLIEGVSYARIDGLSAEEQAELEKLY